MDDGLEAACPGQVDEQVTKSVCLIRYEDDNNMTKKKTKTPLEGKLDINPYHNDYPEKRDIGSEIHTVQYRSRSDKLDLDNSGQPMTTSMVTNEYTLASG